MGRSVELAKPAQRIVSLVPSQTEFLYHLGLTDEVVGLTKFCIHPDSWWKTKTRVGGTKNAKYQRVKDLCPDIILGNKEENDQKNIQELSEIAPVWMSDIKIMDDAYEMMLEIGKLTDREAKAKEIVENIKSSFKSIKSLTISKKALYFIWKDPWMLSGEQTFISHLMEMCGFENMAKNSRYPNYTPGDFSDCELIFLSSEPYPFKEKDIAELKEDFPSTQIKLVDGEMFSWYGSRLLEAPNYFQKLITSIE